MKAQTDADKREALVTIVRESERLRDLAKRIGRAFSSKERLRWCVILLPGGVLPAEPAYKNLLAELGPEADARTKDLVVYAADRPPPDFSIDCRLGRLFRKNYPL